MQRAFLTIAVIMSLTPTAFAQEPKPIAPGAETVFVKQARSYLLAGQAEQALDYTNRALKLNPNSVAALVKRGEAYCLLEEFQLAIKDCDKALSIQPSVFEAIYRKGCALCGLKRWPEAVSYLDQAIRLRPERAMPHLYRGNAEQEQHNYTAALADFDEFQVKAKSTAESSSRPIAYMTAIKCTRAMNRKDLELIQLNKWVASDSGNADARRLRGEWYQGQSRFSDARKEYEAALKIEPLDGRSSKHLKELEGKYVFNEPEHAIPH